MYSVLIVEDELLVSIGLRNMIDWAGMDMQVIGDAQNGEIALEMYHRHKPDLILTDIKMPVMDGMQLIEEIRKNDNRTKIIILTCVQEFDALRKAMRLMVSDYILKLSMSVDEMTTVISKVRTELDNEGQHNDTAPANALIAAQHALRDYAYYKAISLETFTKVADPLSLPESGLVVCLIQAIPQSSNEPSMGLTGAYGSVLCNLLSEHMQREGCGAAVTVRDVLYLVSFGLGAIASAQKQQNAIHALLDRLRDKVCTYLDISIRFGVSTVGTGYATLPALCDEASKALAEGYYIANLPYLSYGNTEGRTWFLVMIEGFEITVRSDEQLSNACREATLETLEALTSMYGGPRSDVCDLVERLIHQLAILSRHQDEQWLTLALETAGAVRTADSLHQVLSLLKHYIHRLSLITPSTGHVSREVGRAVRYIHEHYPKDISLQQVADHVEMSANYLSTLFKKELDVGFVDYLNRVRIEKAGHLLSSTNMKTYEVAAAVGFSDESYFSRIFKRITGVRPREYKRSQASSLPEGLQ